MTNTAMTYNDHLKNLRFQKPDVFRFSQVTIYEHSHSISEIAMKSTHLKMNLDTDGFASNMFGIVKITAFHMF